MNIEELKRVWKTCKNHKLHAITLLSTLLRSQEDVAALNSRLKLSAFERDLASFIIEHREPKISANPLIPLLPYKQVVVKSKAKLSHTIEWVTETLKYNNSPLLKEFLEWKIPKFPVSGSTLKERGIPGGKVMGNILHELKEIWANSDFTLSEEELVKHIDKIMQQLEERKIKKK